MTGAPQLQATLELERIQMLPQARVVAEGIAATLAPFCEVAIQDLLDPGSAIIASITISPAGLSGTNDGSRILPRRRPKSPRNPSNSEFRGRGGHMIATGFIGAPEAPTMRRGVAT
jgi:hypothetical protein